MRFNYSYPLVSELTDTFLCRSRRKDLSLDRCLNDYVEANAFENRRSACFRCPQGRKNRDDFACAKGEKAPVEDLELDAAVGDDA